MQKLLNLLKVRMKILLIFNDNDNDKNRYNDLFLYL